MRARRIQRNGSLELRRPRGEGEALALANKHLWLHRFTSKIDATGDGCHEWTGGKTKGGYGMFNALDRSILAHRMVYRLAGNGLHDVVMHTCDNPSCCNVAHLRGGSHKDNMADMDAKGRRRPGRADHLRDRSSHPRARAVVTPLGEFPSAALAADAHGVAAGTIQRKCRDGVAGFGYR
jgi:hypothetical protein